MSGSWQTDWLDCPACGRKAIPSLPERDSECPDDGPWWTDDQPQVICECGAVLKVECDGETAYAVRLDE